MISEKAGKDQFRDLFLCLKTDLKWLSLTFTKTEKLNFVWKVGLEVRLVGERRPVAAVPVPHVQALPDHDEEAGHEGGQEGGRCREPEVVGRAKPADGSDEDGPEKDQSAGCQPGKDIKIRQDVVTELGL